MSDCTLSEYQKNNPIGAVNELDYLYYVFNQADLPIPIDVFYSIMKLVTPPIKIIDGYIFNSLSFDEAQYKIYVSEGMKISEIQSWLNLIELTSIFENIDWDICIKFANLIVTIWNHSIINNRNEMGTARVIIDEELSEIYLTIDCFIIKKNKS